MEVFGELDANKIIKQLENWGGICLSNFIPLRYRETLLSELKTRNWEQAEAVYGKFSTKQAFARVNTFHRDSSFFAFQFLLAQKLREKLGDMRQGALRSPLHFNDLVAQRYLPGTFGITPHMDGKRYINLIAIAVLEGEGDFYLCHNREGDGKHVISNKAGDLILMRAMGFLGEETRPFHGVGEIYSTRTTFTLRQEKT